MAYDQPANGCPVTQFPDGSDLNDPSTGSTWTQLRTVTRDPSTVWSALTWSSYYSFSSAGADFEIRVYNFLEDWSGPLVKDGTMHIETGYIWPGRS